MASSGTATFTPDISDVIEEAFERVGLESKTGNDVRTARRSLNLLTIDWSNRGINLWTIAQGTVALVDGTASYNLPADTLDLLEHSIRTTSGGVNTDINISRITVSTYSSIPNKAQEGRPVQIWVDRQVTQPKAYVWPVPNNNDYTLVYYRMRRIEDAGNLSSYTPDIPYRFYPALVAGLAYLIGGKKNIDEAKLARLKGEYEELFKTAADEDHDRSSWYIVPDLR